MQHSARIIFAGSPEFAVPTLEMLLQSPHEVVAVLTQPDRPAGRGRKLRPGPVRVAADQASIPVLQPATLRDESVQAQLQSLAADLMVVVAYGLLLPAAVLAIPRVACINLHASLLPRWRGAAPIQMAVLAGDTETGVSVMQMDAGLDTGAVYASRALAINPQETSGQLHDRLARLAAELLAEHLTAILHGDLRAEPQATQGVTYAGRIEKTDGIIDWRQSAVEIDRHIRAFNPWPVAQTCLAGEQLRCWMSALPADPPPLSGMPGSVLSTSAAGIVVQTGEGALLLTRLQLPGRKQVSAGEFAHARNLDGVVLGR